MSVFNRVLQQWESSYTVNNGSGLTQFSVPLCLCLLRTRDNGNMFLFGKNPWPWEWTYASFSSFVFVFSRVSTPDVESAIEEGLTSNDVTWQASGHAITSDGLDTVMWNQGNHTCISTHLPLEKMAAISQKTFANEISRMKSFSTITGYPDFSNSGDYS